MQYAFIWLLCGIVAAMIGARKGEGCGAFILGVLLGPFGILIALLSSGNRITCPYCKELIHKDAIVCKHCGKDLRSPLKPIKYTYRDPVDEWERKQRLQQQTTPEPSPALACPFCSAPIDVSTIQVGKNVCQSCGREFEAE